MTETIPQRVVILCPGQGAQAIGMGKAWANASPAAKAVFDEADAVLGSSLGAPLTDLCYDGPTERIHATDVAQPALYTCGVACWRGLCEQWGSEPALEAAAGLSLGEWTALHLAGSFDFAIGLRLVARRGRLMQDAATASRGSMVALIGADDAQAQEVCDEAAGGEVLVCANYNAPGQIVLSGSASACERALKVAEAKGLRAAPLTVAGAFHSPLMQAAADQLAAEMAGVDIQPPRVPVWSNVTASPHDPENAELLKRRLVEQVTSPVRWAQSAAHMVRSTVGMEQNVGAGSEDATIGWHELAPGSVLRGLMRRIDRNRKVESHDEPE